MNATIEMLTTYGYTAVFTCVLLEQLGLPLPATPVLIAVGALAGLGELNPFAAWLLAIAASLIGDSVWYYLGKVRGIVVLRLLCKLSLEPDACVRKTNSAYSKHGSRWLLFAKFIPGVSTIAPPMAGIYRVNPWKFILMDGTGASLWAGVFIFAGWCFRSQTEMLAAYIGRFGEWFGLSLACALVIYVFFKGIQKRRLYRSLNIAPIAPLELRQRIESGESITIVDLRNTFEWHEGRIPGSISFNEAELDALVSGMWGTGTIILYCSCPNEISSAAAAATRLKRRGAKLIHTLEGGFPRWTKLGYPVEASV
jgi:membrane protein DedA with SNARE-associated domain/rhodanese-related sulfurtransferase